MIKDLKNCTRSVSLFIEPSNDVIQDAKKLGADAIEIHTGKYAEAKEQSDIMDELKRISNAVEYGFSLGLTVNAGHGLDYKNVSKIAQIFEIKEFNIGHYLIGESIFYGLKKVIVNFKKIIQN